MSPTNWTGIIAVCTILGMLGGVMVVAFNITAHFIRLTDAVESGGKTMGRVETGMERLLDKVIEHDNRHALANERLDRLEDIVMTGDDRADSTVKQIIGIGHRKRRNQS